MKRKTNLNQTIEKTTLSNLISNERYARKVLPFIKETYFGVREEKVVFEEITKFVDKYNQKAKFRRGIAALRNLGIKATFRKVYSHYYGRIIARINA